MARLFSSSRMHDVHPREHWDKIVLALAFVAGVGGGIFFKVIGIHPFLAAGYSAAVLCLYALLAYFSTPLRLEPEVIGDNSYYLGFLLTLTSLSVTLYFVVESGAEDRAALIPEVISGFGVALVSTIVGVFIRVLLMQFRVDIVSRERETRVELDQAARKLRTALAQSLQQMKLYTVEGLQRAAEREESLKQATEGLLADTQKAMHKTAEILHLETSQAFQEQASAATEAIRITVSDFSKTALDQIRLSFEEISKTSAGLRDNHASALKIVDQNNAAMAQHTGTIVELLSQMARRIRTVSDEVETSGVTLGQSFASVTDRFEKAVTDSTQRLETGLASFESSNRSAAVRAQVILGDLETRLAASSDKLNDAVTKANAVAATALASLTNDSSKLE